jgi:predicted nucleic acid-binding Zn ribbon protein
MVIMSFKKVHKKAYTVWMVISALVALSMVLLTVAPLFLY